MNKTIIFLMTALMLVGSAMAVYDCGDEGFGCECQNFYQDGHYFALEKWSFNAGLGDYQMDETNVNDHNITVTGDLHSAVWSSDKHVESVLVKAGDDRTAFNGQIGGTINSEKDISHLTFCGYASSSNGGNDDGGDGVPEFSTLTLGVAILITTIGIVYLRKAE